jgi:hypothetical protein
LNQDIEKIDFDSIPSVGLKYLRFLYSEEGSGLSAYKQKYDIFSMVPLERSEEGLKKAKKHLSSIQGHLLKIIEDLSQKGKIDAQKGKRTVIVEGDRFVQRLETDAVPLYRLDIKTEKAKAEAVFISLILNANLIPSHFKRCQKCGNHFYQETPRNKDFCSNSCSSGVWQKKKLGKISDPGAQE